MARTPNIEHNVTLRFNVVTDSASIDAVDRDTITSDFAELRKRAHAEALATNRGHRAVMMTAQGHSLSYYAMTPAQMADRHAELRAQIRGDAGLYDRRSDFSRLFRGYARARSTGDFESAQEYLRGIERQIEHTKAQILAPAEAEASAARRKSASDSWVNDARRILGRARTQAMLSFRPLSPEYGALGDAIDQMYAGSPGSPEHTMAMARAKELYQVVKHQAIAAGIAPNNVIQRGLNSANDMANASRMGLARIADLEARINDPTTPPSERVRATKELERLNRLGPNAIARYGVVGATLAGTVAQHNTQWTAEARAADPTGADLADRLLEKHILKIERDNAETRKALNETEKRIQREEIERARKIERENEVSRGQRLSNAILGRSIAGRVSGFLSSSLSASGDSFETNFIAGSAKTLSGAVADITMGRYIAGSGGPIAMAVSFAVDAIVGAIGESVKRGQALQATATERRGQRLMGIGQMYAADSSLGGGLTQEMVAGHANYMATSGVSGSFIQSVMNLVDNPYKALAEDMETRVDLTRKRLDTLRNVAHTRFGQGGLFPAEHMEQMMSSLSMGGVNIHRFAQDYDVGSSIAKLLGFKPSSLFGGRVGPLMSGYGIGGHMASVAANTGLDPRVIVALTAAGAGGRGGALRVEPDGSISSAAGALGGLVQSGMVTMPGATQVGSLLAEMVSRGYQGNLGRNISFYGNLGSAGLDVRHTSMFMQGMLNTQQGAGQILGEGMFAPLANVFRAIEAFRGTSSLSEAWDRNRSLTAGQVNAALPGGELGRLIRMDMGLSSRDAALAGSVGEESSAFEVFKRISKALSYTSDLKNEEQLRKESYGLGAGDEARAKRIEMMLDSAAADLASIARSLGAMVTGQ